MKNPRAGDHELFGFLTCDANEIVKPIHSKAMPVILDGPGRDRAMAYRGVEGRQATSKVVPLGRDDAAAARARRRTDAILAVFGTQEGALKGSNVGRFSRGSMSGRTGGKSDAIRDSSR